jgi:hypothetical protein
MSVTDDASRVKVGSRSLRFDTASGYDTGVKYPAAGDLHWDLTGKEALVFWIYAINANPFQGPQPVLVLNSPAGTFRYEPQTEGMFIDEWHLYQIPLAGSSEWVRTAAGAPTLADITSFEIHHDTWGFGFTLYYDGLEFVANIPPAVSITSPADGTVVMAPASITITADASDSLGTVAKVEFFQGTTKLGEAATSPYSFAWTNVPAGSYSLTAIATDNLGAATTSAPVNVIVNSPPTVNITSPASGATFTAPANVTISASASDSDGSVAKVEFFKGGTKLGEALASPYTFVWSGIAAGTYVLTARATDNLGATATSAAVNITVVVSPGAGELTEGNAASWGTFASDGAPTSVTDDSTFVKMGSQSIKFVTASGSDTGIKYPATPSVHWDLSNVNFLTFWAYLVNATGDLANQPVIVLNSPDGSFTYTPQGVAMRANSWHLFQMALTGDSYWTPTATGTPTLTDITQIEIHQQAGSAGFTTYYDGVQFVAALPGELTEGNASLWGTFASDAAASSVTDDSTFVKVGSQSIKFVTASGYDTGVTYPAAGNAHWDLTGKDHLAFWVYAINNNPFQGNQPTVALKGPGGSFRYEAQGTLMYTNQWHLYQVPLAGGGPWTLTVTGSPSLSQIDQLEIHHDTWDFGFTLYYDGLGFGSVLPSLTLNPVRVIGGTTSTGTVTLADPAPAGGAVLTLSSSNTSVATVPASITVPAGSTSASFTVTTSAVGSSTSVTVTATLASLTTTAILTVDPALSALSVSPASVVGGDPSTGSVTLAAAAPAGGAVVSLSSSDTSVATVPASVTVPAGSTSASFTVTTSGVGSSTSVTLTATLASITKTAILTVIPALSALSVSPGSVVGSDPSTGSVTLTAAAPAGGAVVSLSSSNTSVATVPASVTVPQGQSSATFTVTTLGVASTATITISAIRAGSTLSATLTVLPLPTLVRTKLVPNITAPTGTATGTVFLSGPAPSAGASVALASSNPSLVTVPASVVVPAGVWFGTFTATPVGSGASATVSATYRGLTQSDWIAVTGPIDLDSVWLTPSTLVGGGTATVGIVLNVPTLTSRTITLSSSNPSVLPLPASLTIAAFKGGASVTVATTTVASTTPVTITATSGTTVKTAVLTITPTPALSSFSLAPTSVTAYGLSTGTVTLNAAAPPGGATVALSSPPTSVRIAAGLRSVTFSVYGPNVTTTTDVTINAAYAGLTLAAVLNVTPSVAPLDVKITPDVLKGSTSSSGSVTMNGTQTTTATVALSSSQPSLLAVPASVSVFPGALASPLFTVTTASVTLPTTVTVSATYGGSTKTTTVNLTPGPAISALTVGATSLVAGSSTSGTVYLDGPAGVGGETVSLESSDPSAASVPDTVSVPAGATGASFTITAGAVSQTSLARLSASAGGQTSTLDVTVTPTPVVLWLSLDRTSVAGGGTIVPTGTVRLNGAAPAGGVTVSLSSENPTAASVPTTITIPAGASQGTFTVTTSAVAVDTTVTIVASVGTSAQGYTLTVRRPRVVYVTTNPQEVVGGQPLTATVALDGPAPAGGMRVNIRYISDNSIYLQIPNQQDFGSQFGWVMADAGQTQVSFPIQTFPQEVVSCGSWVQLWADTGFDDNKDSQFNVLNLRVDSVTVSPSRVVGGSTAAVTVLLNGTPPNGPVTVPLANSNPAVVSVPSSVVMAGASLTFNVTTTAVAADTPVTITATYGFGTSYTPISRSVVLTVTPNTTLASLTLTPSSLVGGNASTGRVTLSAGAPPGGVAVTLSSNSANATVPASVTVPAGLDNATFVITTTTVSTTTQATITAAYAATSQTAALSISAAPAVSAVTITPASVTGGTSASGTVTLNAVAPSGGVSVTLNSSNTAAATAPASVMVAQGQVQAAFTVTTSTVATDANVTITATGGGSSATAPLTVRAPSPQLDGVSPGAALPGDSNLVAYGSNFASTTTIQMSGPVYTLTNTTTQLCSVLQNQCPTVTPPSVVNGTLNAISFSLPADLTTGYYWVQARSVSGALSGGTFLRVDAALKSRAVVPPAQHNNAPSIMPGQTFVGTFATNNDPSNTFGDYNDFYFVATAGTTINVTLDRADATLPWEHPDALDPQIEVIAPDGVVYANLKATDRQPAIDLNATLSGAVLPQTGVYWLRAETLKGFGDYRLTFSYGSVATASAAQRSIAFSGSVNTVPLNTSVWLQAVMLDPRGYTTSGAIVLFSTANGPDDHATVQFPLGVWAYTNTDGVAAGSARPTTVGKAQLTAAYQSTLLGSFTMESNTERAEAPIPRYAPVAIAPMRGVSVSEDGSLVTESGKYETLPVWTPAEPTTRGGTGPRRAVGEGLAPSRPASGKSTAAIGSSLPLPPGAGRGEGRTGSLAAALPLPLPLTAVPESISTCSGALFTLAGVNWASTNPPYTVTLTDEMPSTGQSQPNGVVDALGIHGHRIEKTIRMKIDIKDASGSTPPHAVLVNLSLSGPSHGTLILDPDGNRVQCSTASFLWHERDAQGNIIALNEEFEYKLGTYAPYVGAVPDIQNPLVLKPVWGTAEVLGLVVSTVDATGANLRQSYTYKVHPEPAKPDHFAVSVPPPPSGTPEPVWTYWSDNGKAAGLTVNGRSGNGVDLTAANRYYLMDRYENVTFGYTALQQPVAPGQTISISFFDQTSGATPTGGAADPNGYGWRVLWNDNPAMPSGAYSSTLTLNYPVDPEWGAGSVSKPLNFQFDRGTFQFLIGIDGWDYLVNPPLAYDPRPPWTVSPGASGDALPKSVNQPDALGPQTPIDPARFALVLGRGTFTPAAPYPVFAGSDPVVEVVDNPAFRVSLVDAKNAVATDARFQVHLCPRVDHFPPSGQPPRPCTTTPVQSSAGVIDSIRVNASGPGAADSQGYMGVELLQAPMNPGTYYIKFETLEGKQYRVRVESDIAWDRTPAGEYQGAFAFVTVMGVEVLDENFTPVNVPEVDVETLFYVRFLETDSTLPASQTLTLLIEANGIDDTTGVDVPVTRAGHSPTYIGPFVLAPDAADMPSILGPSLEARRVRLTAPRKAVKAGHRSIHWKRQNKVIGTTPQNTPFELLLSIDTSTPAQQPNLLFADGIDSTRVTASLVTRQGKPFYSPMPMAISTGSGQGTLETLAAGGGPTCSYSFTYRAPLLPVNLNDNTVYRPVFYATILSWPIVNPTIGLPFKEGGQTPKYQWPMYYYGHRFKDMLSDFEYQWPGSLLPNEAAVRSLLGNVPASTLAPGGPSYLKDFYFVNMPDPPPGSTNYPPATAPVNGFIDTNGNGTYDLGEPVYCALHLNCLPLSVISVNPFSHVLADMSQRFGLSPANMITNLQKELHFVEVGTSDTQVRAGDALDRTAMGCDIGNPAMQGFLRQLVCAGINLRNRFNDQDTQRVDFFQAPTGDPDADPQVVNVCSDLASRRVSAAYQPAHAATRAEAKYTPRVVACLDSGTYSFSYWWSYFFFGGTP